MKQGFTLLIASTLFGAGAFAAEPADRPIGVEADQWIPVSEKLGFVVVASTAEMPSIQGPNPQLLLNKVVPDAPATGYFMIKSESGWRRLVVLTPADIAALRRAD